MEIVYLIMGATAGVFLGFTAGGYMLLKELAKKDREIANKKAMIKNRDEKIDELVKQRNEARNNYDTELKRTELQDKQIECIKTILEQNSYSRDDLKIAKRKELVEDYQANN